MKSKFNRMFNLIMEDLYNFPGDLNLDKNISVKSNFNYDDKKSNIKVDNPKLYNKKLSDSFGTSTNIDTLRKEDKIFIRSILDVLKLDRLCKDGVFPYLVIDMEDATGLFKNLHNLKEIKGLDTSKVKNMREMFFGCSSLKTIPQMDTSKVKNMREMFNYCLSLKSIPQINTSKVTNMREMFHNCKSLETIPQLNTSKVVNMSYMFAYCKSLKSIPQIETSKVITMKKMFYGCLSLETIPLLDTSNVINLVCTFVGCNSLKKLPKLPLWYKKNNN